MKTFLLAACSLVSLISFAQEQPAKEHHPFSKHSIYAQGGGSSYGWGLIYDHIFISKPKWKLTGGAGASVTLNGILGVGFPVYVSSLIGKNKNHFELRTGFINAYGLEGEQDTIFLTSDIDRTSRFYSLHSVTTVGYRFQRPQGGFFFTIGVDFIASIVREDQFTDGYFQYYADGLFTESGRKYGLLYNAGIGYTFKPKRS